MHHEKNGAWFVIADTNICKIYSHDTKLHQLHLCKEIEHPENKLKNVDLVSDGPGSYQAMHARGAYAPPSDPKEVKIDTFAREIAEALNADRNNQLYNKLVIIALPHMNGLICKHLNKHVKDLVAHNIEKDLLHLQDHELVHFIQLHYADIFR